LAGEIALSLASLGYVEELRGDLDAAEACHREGLRLARDLPGELPLAAVLEGLACVAAARRQPRRAAVLLGAAESIRVHTGALLPPQERVEVERAAGAAASALGPEAVAALTEQGRRMSIQQAVAYASAGDLDRPGPELPVTGCRAGAWAMMFLHRSQGGWPGPGGRLGAGGAGGKAGR
jgi:hypothetical protein